MMLTRAQKADFINGVLNDPNVYPWVCGAKTELLDVAPVVADRNNVVLVGEFGGVIFHKLDVGLYEAHTAVLVEGRGRWTLQMGYEALDYMFCRTDAVEILTKCPHGNLWASAGARAIGATKDFTTRPLWPLGGEIVPIDVYSLSIQNWIRRSLAMVAEGQSVHSLLKRHGIAVDHGEDTDHDRYVGAAWTMIRNGQIGKGLHFYYRWAKMAGYRPITVLNESPLRLDIGTAILALDGENWSIVKPEPLAAA